MSLSTRTGALVGGALVALVLVGAGLGAANSFGAVYRDRSGHTVAPSVPVVTPSTSSTVDQSTLSQGISNHDQWSLPGWVQPLLGTLFALLILAVLVGVIVYVAQHPPRRRRPEAAPPELAEEVGSYDATELARSVRRETEASLAGLEAGRLSAADAIIDCWRRLVAAGTGHGIARQETDTSSDYAARVLSATGAAPATVETLAGLYRHAMFGAWAPDALDAQRAADCLRDIVAELEPTHA